MQTVKEVAAREKAAKSVISKEIVNFHLTKDSSTQTSSFLDELASHEAELVDWEMDKAWHEMDESYN